MNKTQLIASVAEIAKVTKKDAEKAVSAVLESVEAALVAGEKVQLIGFGTYEVKSRSARVGRNPQTGKEIKIAAKTVAQFKAGKALSEAVNKKKK